MLKNVLEKFGVNKTRWQIFTGFIIITMIVLMITVGTTYFVLKKVQKESAEQYVNEIAEQMSGRLDALLNEINVLSLQLSTDARIQDMLLNENYHPGATIDERMAIRSVILNYTAYSDTIKEIELFSIWNNLYPVVDTSIRERVGRQYVQEADRPEHAGDIVWIGKDPKNPSQLLAVRQIRLEETGFKRGGYLVIQVKPELVDFIKEDISKIEGTVLNLYDGEAMQTNQENTMPPLLSMGGARYEGRDYIQITENIQAANWTLEILIPESEVTSEIEILSTVLLWVSGIGILLSLILSYYLSLLITSPIKQLSYIIGNQENGDLRVNPQKYFNLEVNQLNTTYNKMVYQNNHLVKSVLEKEILKSKSEIKALHSQINPHFLFNTLDSLYWSLISKGDKQSGKFVIKLAQFFRYSIIKVNNQEGFVTLDQEMEQIKRYTDIMKIRWESRLLVEFKDENNLEQYELPKLTIQPIVENAIIHGIEPLEDGGTVVIEVKEGRDDKLIVTVQDNGVGMDSSKLSDIKSVLEAEDNNENDKGIGIGLFNIHKLIQFYFGKEFGLEIESKVNEGTTVTIRLPKR